MTSRGSIAQRQGRASLKRTDIGHSKSTECLMVKIDWTQAKVVRIEINKNFTMQAATVRVLHGTYDVLAEVSVNVHDGQVFYFVASDGFPGWYYVLVYSEARSAFTCSCVRNSKYRQACDHQMHATVFVGHRYVQRKELELRIDQDLEVHIDEELRMAELEREFSNLSSVA